MSVGGTLEQTPAMPVASRIHNFTLTNSNLSTTLPRQTQALLGGGRKGRGDHGQATSVAAARPKAWEGPPSFVLVRLNMRGGHRVLVCFGRGLLPA